MESFDNILLLRSKASYIFEKSSSDIGSVLSSMKFKFSLRSKIKIVTKRLSLQNFQQLRQLFYLFHRAQVFIGRNEVAQNTFQNIGIRTGLIKHFILF